MTTAPQNDDFDFYKAVQEASFVQSQKDMFEEFARIARESRAKSRKRKHSKPDMSVDWNDFIELLATEDERGFSNSGTICYLCSGNCIRLTVVQNAFLNTLARSATLRHPAHLVGRVWPQI